MTGRSGVSRGRQAWGSLSVEGGPASNLHGPVAYRRSLEQKAHWERDRRVQVTLRPLRYEVERAAGGVPVLDINGNQIVKGMTNTPGMARPAVTRSLANIGMVFTSRLMSTRPWSSAQLTICGSGSVMRLAS